MQFPESIEKIVGTAGYREDSLGKSDASVLLFEDYVLKVRPAGTPETMDVQAMTWLRGRLPVPEIVVHEVSGGRDWLLMTRMRGKMLCDESIMERPGLLLDLMAEALHLLWSVPSSSCPLVRTAEESLTRAEHMIRDGYFDPADCEEETFGEGGFESPMALVEWLREHRPPVDPVFTHGDFCLPNLFTDGRRFTGFIDLGGAGVSDRWMDLALGWRSILHNSDGHYGKVYRNVDPDDLFRAAGVPKDEEKLRYYLLLDELN
ncbi:MAG: aminoglycoside 3'-phosphotransferase [Clostridia bacterium]|nr:aminoglycoside 3'-phosphotransferase [Clostridia bacterium]